MRQLLFFLISIVLFTTCKPKQPRLKMAYIGIIGQNSIIAFKQDSVLILENMNMSKIGFNPHEYSFKTYVYNGDTLKQNMQTIVRPPVSDTIAVRRMRSALFYIDSIGNYLFPRDETPAQLKALFKEGEEILVYKKYLDGGYHAYTTLTESNAGLKLYITQTTGEKGNAIQLEGNAYPNFLLFDITGDKIPEVFVFRNWQLNSKARELAEVGVYKIEQN